MLFFLNSFSSKNPKKKKLFLHEVSTKILSSTTLFNNYKTFFENQIRIL